jgi:hypothetical protein
MLSEGKCWEEKERQVKRPRRKMAGKLEEDI